MRRVVLLGGGHAHAQVLRAFRNFVSRELQVTLVTPEPVHTYSGMVPGVIAGHYRTGEAQIDLARLARGAAAQLVLEKAVAIDPSRRTVTLEQGRILQYDNLSINIGSVPRGAGAEGVPVKPFEPFIARWQSGAQRIAVVGGGAAGVELAMAMGYRLNRPITLFSDRNEFRPEIAERLKRQVELLKIDLQRKPYEPGNFDAIFWATGAGPSPLLKDSGLALDDAGFVRVDESLRSVSHPEVFAAGDAASFPRPLPKSGVYAVRQGAILARNLKRAIVGRRLEAYVPQEKTLYLISCGRKYAIASRGDWSAEGPWAWRWKDWIDRRWMSRFR